MTLMEHPNGCVHNVRDDLIPRFEAAGWKIKEAPCEPPVVPAEQEKPKAKRKRKTTTE